MKEYSRDFTDEEMIHSLQEFCRINIRRPMMKDFKGKKPSDAMITKRFGTWLNALKIAGITVDKIRDKDYTKDFLRNCLIEYKEKYNKIPTTRGLASKGYPTTHAFINHFGSFKNALEDVQMLELRNDSYQFCDTHTDEELLEKLRVFMSDKERIPVGDFWKKTKEISVSSYDRRFGGIYSALRMIGYDIDTQRKSDDANVKEDMINKFKELGEILQKVPTSRDLDEYSKNGFGYAAKTYEVHFGGIINTQLLSGFEIKNVGRLKTHGDMIDDLIEFSEELGRTPTQTEVANREDFASIGTYSAVFGTYRNALKIAELEPISKVYYSLNNDICLSVYELKFTDMLINNKIKYTKEVFYRDVIDSFDKKYRFDYKIEINDSTFYVEIFGMTCNKNYEKKTQEKIKLCKDNNVPLIEFYPSNFHTSVNGELYSQLMSMVDILNKK